MIGYTTMQDSTGPRIIDPPTISSPLLKGGRIKEGRWLYGSVSTFIFAVILAASPVLAANEKDIARRTQSITSQLSCVVCSGQSVASSNAALAQDMRAFIAAKLRDGKSEAEIKAFLRRRYGDKILMRPPVKPATYILWVAPLIALLAGVAIIYGFYRKGRRI